MGIKHLSGICQRGPIYARLSLMIWQECQTLAKSISLVIASSGKGETESHCRLLLTRLHPISHGWVILYLQEVDTLDYGRLAATQRYRWVRYPTRTLSSQIGVTASTAR